MLNIELKWYIEQEILPRYAHFDPAHRREHVDKVIANSMSLAATMDVDADMVYAIAAYHDVGLAHGRERHGETSGEMLAADVCLRRWFSGEQIVVMAQAVVDHRASNEHPPRSIYGRIVAEADRDISYKTILRRTLEYSMHKFPDYSAEQHWHRTHEHITDKYGVDGYLKLWIELPCNVHGLEEVRKALFDVEQMREDFYALYNDYKS